MVDLKFNRCDCVIFIHFKLWGRGRKTQLQVGKKYFFFNLSVDTICVPEVKWIADTDMWWFDLQWFHQTNGS